MSFQHVGSEILHIHSPMKNRSLFHHRHSSFVTPDEFAGYINMWESLRADGYVAPIEEAAVYSEAGTDTSSMVAGKAVFTQLHSNQLAGYQGVMEDELDIIDFPDAVNGYNWKQPSQYFGVNADTAHAEAAIDFINFFVNNIEAGKILGCDRGVPCNSQVRSALSKNASATDKKVFDFFAAATPVIGDWDTSLPNDQEFNDTFKLLYQQAMYGMLSPEDAGKQMYDTVQYVLSK